MQILGLADSTPKPQNRFRSLIWPEIRSEVDVDHIGRQGFSICIVVAIFSLVFGFLQGGIILTAEGFESVFFFLSGVGIRMRSVFAAASAFLVYFASSFIVGFGFARLIACALLLANVRGTWLSARWRTSQTEPPPVPLTETLLDRFVDQMPIAIWPVGQFIYYGFAAIEFGLLMIGLISLFILRHRG